MTGLLRSVLALLLLAATMPADAREATIRVFAAASLSGPLTEAADIYERAHGQKILTVFAGSSTLARQITAGAGADIFLSADREWAAHVRERGFAHPSPARIVARNTLLLIGASPGTQPPPPCTRATLDRLLVQNLGDKGRLALADPDHVPAGRYAMQALEALDISPDHFRNRLAPAQDVRMAFTYVARGEAPIGIVYGTEAFRQPRVHILCTFLSDSHRPIVYPAVLLQGADKEATAFLRWLSGPDGRRIFANHGFPAPGK